MPHPRRPQVSLFESAFDVDTLPELHLCANLPHAARRLLEDGEDPEDVARQVGLGSRGRKSGPSTLQ